MDAHFTKFLVKPAHLIAPIGKDDNALNVSRIQ